MCLGMSIGSALGVAADNLSLFMCIGMSIGVGLGAVIDAKNRKAAESNEDESEEQNDSEDISDHD